VVRLAPERVRQEALDRAPAEALGRDRDERRVFGHVLYFLEKWRADERPFAGQGSV
jgi:hypothetical protein